MKDKVQDLALIARCVVGNDRVRREFKSGVLTLGCLSAFDYIMAKQGTELMNEQKRRVFAFLELGKVINNYYDDTNPLARDSYKKNRRELFGSGLRRDDFRFYFKAVADLERSRPNPWQLDGKRRETIEDYRYKTNLVYWAAACAVGGVAPITELVDPNYQYTSSAPVWFRGMHDYLLALQVIDDQIGWKGDVRGKRPSFFTGFCPRRYLDLEPETIPDEIVAETFRSMDERYSFFKHRADCQIPAAYAMSLGISLLKFVPALVRSKNYRVVQEFTGVELVNARHFDE